FCTSWYQWQKGKSKGARRRQARRTGARFHRPQLEALEGRTLLSVCSPSMPLGSWTSEILSRGSGDSASWTQKGSPGSGYYLHGEDYHGTVQNDTGIVTTITAAHTLSCLGTYDSAAQGPISTLDFGFDFAINSYDYW